MIQKKNEDQLDTLETGDLFFFYRPQVDEEDPQSRQDVQRLYMVLSPHDKKKLRLTVIGRKKMPDPASPGRERYWGFVDLVRDSPGPIRDALGQGSYETKTRGKQHLPAARPAGEGIYRILRHGSHTHLVYALELPDKPGQVQDELNIEPQASYIVSVANPQRPAPPGVGLGSHQQADYPRHLQDVFRGRRFAELDPPLLLDHEGAEFLLIAAAKDVGRELGIDLDPEKESASSADLFKQLRLDREKHPSKPLLKGQWD